MASSKNEDFSFFFEEINKYSSNIHKLNPGVELCYIEEVEKELNIIFPKIYKDFLQVCNGGELFIPGTVLSEIYSPLFGKKKLGIAYLNESFHSNRRRPEMPNNLLIIADLNYGDSICFDLNMNNGQDAVVVQWDTQDRIISRTWEGFKTWLLDVLEEGSLLIDYNSNDKNFDFL